jgi:hypothetical protein
MTKEVKQTEPVYRVLCCDERFWTRDAADQHEAEHDVLLCECGHPADDHREQTGEPDYKYAYCVGADGKCGCAYFSPPEEEG